MTDNVVALSVLVASVHTRWNSFAPKIQESLYGQYNALSAADQERVEIILLADTKSMGLGDKRNRMVELASGEYAVFVDDDDRLSDDYLISILAAIDESHPDVVTFKASVSIDGRVPKPCIYSIEWDQDHNTDVDYRRLPNHICAIRRELTLAAPFPSVQYREDALYAAGIKPLLKTQHAIDRVLYHYDYSNVTTETQMVGPPPSPEVDVVILSKSDSAELAAMTQHAIDTCRAGADDYPVNVIVVEQAPGVWHRDAVTLHRADAFAYNRFANAAAATGTAPWIMVANNDLEFEDGWLGELLAQAHDVMSPLNPGDGRQAGVGRFPIVGTTNGRHFSGWCFMVRRGLWEEIGGFDEDFRFWCADDAVIEQVVAAGVEPMLVPASRVRHLTSQTLRKESNDDGELTWAQVALFEEKYGVKKFEGDARYAAWKRSRDVNLHQN